LLPARFPPPSNLRIIGFLGNATGISSDAVAVCSVLIW